MKPGMVIGDASVITETGDVIGDGNTELVTGAIPVWSLE